jgi:hypothetical protein
MCADEQQIGDPDRRRIEQIELDSANLRVSAARGSTP